MATVQADRFGGALTLTVLTALQQSFKATGERLPSSVGMSKWEPSRGWITANTSSTTSELRARSFSRQRRRRRIASRYARTHFQQLHQLLRRIAYSLRAAFQRIVAVAAGVQAVRAHNEAAAFEVNSWQVLNLPA